MRLRACGLRACGVRAQRASSLAPAGRRRELADRPARRMR
ncbi:MAG: hypothetical protein AVDCRST_MAG77-6206 [uncultured Chloroflexi bacterium]|uniref:Uncharacterized protein n=1 Tax=uncultured Chloroflexota bacterium TaxID=166587 RepID=A0A6J4KMV5_9CHLR|nr:MAG: hypothetical protein AVDCRST_MAG77-6206 [uncultured Chloroflexota bacterium]